MCVRERDKALAACALYTAGVKRGRGMKFNAATREIERRRS